MATFGGAYSTNQQLARFKPSNRGSRVNLETTHRSVAGLKINGERKQVVDDRLNGVSITTATATMALFIDAFLETG